MVVLLPAVISPSEFLSLGVIEPLELKSEGGA